MALYKQAEFAQKCGIDKAYLSVNKKRGKVILNEDDLIDDSNPINKLFFERCLARPKAIAAITDQPQDSNTEPPKPKKDTKQGEIEFGEITQRTLDKMGLDAQKKVAEIEKLNKEISALQRKAEKDTGKLLPTDLVTSMCKRVVHTYGKKFRGSLDNISGIWGKRFKLNRNEISELRKAMLDELNRADKDATEELKAEIENIVEEYTTVNG